MATVSATGITSGFGLRFPLRFPASVSWSGGPGLAVASSAADVTAARRQPGTLAVLDLTAGTLLAVRAGTVILTVAAGGQSTSATVSLTG